MDLAAFWLEGERLAEELGLADPASKDKPLEDPVVVEQTAVRRRLALGPELAAMAARRHLFPVSWPDSLAEDPAGAASRRKKNF